MLRKLMVIFAALWIAFAYVLLYQFLNDIGRGRSVNPFYINEDAYKSNFIYGPPFRVRRYESNVTFEVVAAGRHILVNPPLIPPWFGLCFLGVTGFAVLVVSPSVGKLWRHSFQTDASYPQTNPGKSLQQTSTPPNDESQKSQLRVLEYGLPDKASVVGNSSQWTFAIVLWLLVLLIIAAKQM